MNGETRKLYHWTLAAPKNYANNSFDRQTSKQTSWGRMWAGLQRTRIAEGQGARSECDDKVWKYAAGKIAKEIKTSSSSKKKQTLLTPEACVWEGECVCVCLGHGCSFVGYTLPPSKSLPLAALQAKSQLPSVLAFMLCCHALPRCTCRAPASQMLRFLLLLFC